MPHSAGGGTLGSLGRYYYGEQYPSWYDIVHTPFRISHHCTLPYPTAS